MPVFLFLLGILLAGVGLFLVGFSIPFRDFSLGNTLIISGAIGITGGVVVIGIAATLRELRKIAKVLDAGAATPRPAVAAATTPAARPAPAPLAPPRQAAKPPPVVNTARSQRAEPRLDAPADAAAEPEMPPAPTIADITAERPRGLFASIRGRSQATTQPAKRPTPSVGPAPGSGPAGLSPPLPPGPGGPLPDDDDHPLPPPPRGAHPDRPPFHPEHDADPELPPAQRSPSLSALAARTAARLDLPRPVPDLPRVASERASSEPPAYEPPAYEPPAYEPPAYERAAPEPPPEKPSRNMFDSVWPSDGKASAARSIEAPPPEPKAPEILKSGVIDGMAYTLYTDGSIEAQLPQGTLRFTSIDDLRAHLERGG